MQLQVISYVSYLQNRQKYESLFQKEQKYSKLFCNTQVLIFCEEYCHLPVILIRNVKDMVNALQSDLAALLWQCLMAESLTSAAAIPLKDYGDLSLMGSSRVPYHIHHVEPSAMDKALTSLS